MILSKSYSEERDAIYSADGLKYPGGALVRMELVPGYERAKMKLLDHIKSINEAHLIMLYEQGIVNPENAICMMKVIEEINYDDYRKSSYTGQFEDLYLQMEDEIIKKTNGIGGNLHIARSRNDMCVAWSHMAVREDVLALMKLLIRVQNTIFLFAREHKDTLYVIHTHTQHAQPGLLGHYFLGVADVINRNVHRLQNAYKAINCSPMGAAAVTTSGFPISRERVAELVGFDTVIENSYDAIGNCDYFTETASTISLCSVDFGRFITDMVLWATEEMKMIRIADGYISTSSIMPQKRNPIALEHLRSSLSIVKGFADAVSLGFMKSPYGDISDYEDIEDTLSEAIRLLMNNLILFNSVIATLDVDKELLARRAYESFSVVTEIADEMYRSYHIPFREAHHFVSYLVKKADRLQYNLKNLTQSFFAETYEEFFKIPFNLDFAPMLKSIDPLHFVKSRNVLGGTGPNAMEDMLISAEKKIADNVEWYRGKIESLLKSQERRAVLVQKLTDN